VGEKENQGRKEGRKEGREGKAKQRILDVGEDKDKLEHLCSVGGNLKS
jgi:hypothetical protein